MTLNYLNGYFTLNFVLRHSSKTWLSELGYTLKLVVNVGEL